MEVTKLRLSVSKVKTFEQCKKKYYYQYILKLPTIPKDFNALGSMVHLVLETMFQKWIDQQYVPPLAKLLREAWFESLEESEGISAKEFGVLEEAKKFAKGYYQHFVSCELTKPIKVESSFNIPITINPTLHVELIGYIDRIDEIREGKLLVLDYKTTNKVEYLDFFQLGIYIAACVNGPYPGHDYEAAYILLRHDFKQKKMPNAASDYKGALDKLVKLAIDIDKTQKSEIYPPSKSPLCKWCDYRARCQKDTGGAESW